MDALAVEWFEREHNSKAARARLVREMIYSKSPHLAHHARFVATVGPWGLGR